MRAFNQRLASLPPTIALSEIKDAKLAHKCIPWILSSNKLIRNAFGKDFEFLALLGHFVLAEEQERALQDALRTPLVDEYPIRKLSVVEHEDWPYHWYGKKLFGLRQLSAR